MMNTILKNLKMKITSITMSVLLLAGAAAACDRMGSANVSDSCSHHACSHITCSHDTDNSTAKHEDARVDTIYAGTAHAGAKALVRSVNVSRTASHYWACNSCGGNGRCWTCGGSGLAGSGYCSMCSGTGRCYYCKGTGRL